MNAIIPFRTSLLVFGLAVGTPANALAENIQDGRDPTNFTTTIDNPFFPLVPGTTYIYEGTKEGSPVNDTFEVTSRTKLIMGVKCREIADKVYVDGFLEVDPAGNVVSTEGSWEAGVNGAMPGILMEAHPRVGDTYQQEFSQGVAEDMATVLSLNKTVKVPFGTFRDCLQTKEFTPLEPGQFEYKYYAYGVGFIRSVLVKGGKEELNLVRIVTN
jgi:hypothetical protein